MIAEIEHAEDETCRRAGRLADRRFAHATANGGEAIAGLDAGDPAIVADRHVPARRRIRYFLANPREPGCKHRTADGYATAFSAKPCDSHAYARVRVDAFAVTIADIAFKFPDNDMLLKPTALTLAFMMCLTSVAVIAARPNAKAVDKGNAVSLEAMVPKGFGDWTELHEQSAQVVNPQTQEILDKLYSQILTRSYVNKQGYRIMLSMAYGDDQRGGLQAHRPEVCYPAQGFALIGKIEDGSLATAYGNIEVRRLSTKLGARNEPVTYWLTVGDQVIRNALDKRMAQIRLGLTGQIPDGLLFRVSSIDDDAARGFAMQQKFTADMMAAVPTPVRKQLSGLAPPAAPQAL